MAPTYAGRSARSVTRVTGTHKLAGGDSNHIQLTARSLVFVPEMGGPDETTLQSRRAEGADYVCLCGRVDFILRGWTSHPDRSAADLPLDVLRVRLSLRPFVRQPSHGRSC